MPQRYVECKKGWVVSRDANGNYVPFFVNVRSKDIVPTDNETSPLILNLRSYGTNGKIISNSQIYNFDLQSWNISVLNDEEISYRKKISIGSDGNVNLASPSDMVITLELPLPLIDDELLDVRINKSVFNAQLAYATDNIEFVHDSNRNISAVKIHFYNLSYLFPANFRDNDTFKNSYIYFNITGRYTSPAVNI